MAVWTVTSHPSQEREGWGTRAFVSGLEVEGWAIRLPRPPKGMG
jgi:hypothetical protein